MRKYLSVIVFALVVLALTQAAFAVINITDIIDSPDPVEVNDTTIIDCNVTDNETTIDTVFIEIDHPSAAAANYTMTNITNTKYRYSYSPNESGAYTYRIYANNSLGNWSQSGLYSFVAYIPGPPKNYTKKITEISIAIEIAASCDGGITFYYAPDYVIRGQHVVFVMMVQNVGNLPQNQTTTLIIRNPNGTALGNFIPLISQSQTGPGILTFDTYEADPGDYTFQFGIWDSSNYSVGDYSATATLTWDSIFESGNSTESWSSLNSTSNCTNISYENSTGFNTSVCYKTVYDRCQFLEVGSQNDILTNQTTNLTVVNMAANTTGKYGNMTLSGTPYHMYIFNITNCTSGYCYACTTPDKTINESSECAIQGNLLDTPIGLYRINDVDDEGRWLNITAEVESCSFFGHIYNCSLEIENGTIVNGTVINGTINDTIECNVTLICNGEMAITKIFPILETYGNESGTEPEPIPEPTPTPEPEPSPSPTPEPQPQPTPEPEAAPGSNESVGQTQLAINIEPIDRDVRGEQGQWIPAVFNVTNIGGYNITDIELIPMVMEGWEVKTATVDFIDVAETLNRTLFVKPPFDAPLSRYVIPVKAVRGNLTLDMDYYWLSVLEAGNRTRLEILEVPGTIGIVMNSRIDAPVLVKNTGKIALHGITATLENAEQCIVGFNYTAIPVIDVNETVSMTLSLKSGEGLKKCDSTLIVGSEEKSYAFADIEIAVTAGPGFLPEMPLAAYIPLILAIIIAILIKIKKGREAQEMEPGAVRTIINILLLLLLLLILYIVLGYLEFVPLF